MTTETFEISYNNDPGNVVLESNLIVRCSNDIYSKLMTYIDAVDIEISGMGYSSYADGIVTIEDLHVLPQECTGVETELDQKALAKFMEARHRSGDTRPINVWWHSHVRMGCFWSGVDQENALSLAENKDMFLSLVACKDGQVRCRVDIGKPFKLTIDKLRLNIDLPQPDNKAIDQWTKEAKSKVRVKTFKPSFTTTPKIWQSPARDTSFETNTCYRIVPAPKLIRMWDGTLKAADEKDNIPHDVWCHAHKDSVACERCDIISCKQCPLNTGIGIMDGIYGD